MLPDEPFFWGDDPSPLHNHTSTATASRSTSVVAATIGSVRWWCLIAVSPSPFRTVAWSQSFLARPRCCQVPDCVGCPPASTDVVDNDIAFFQGELYVVLTKKHHISGSESELPELHRLEIDEQQNRVRSVQCIHGTPRNSVDDPGLREHQSWRSVSYLAECGDRLLMVDWRTVVEKFVVWDSVSRESGSRTIRTQIKVWEGVDLTGSHGHWSKADTLMGHALFVSRGCSESLPAAQCGARQDCIYFMMTEHPRLRSRRKWSLRMTSCAVLCTTLETGEWSHWRRWQRRPNNRLGFSLPMLE